LIIYTQAFPCCLLYLISNHACILLTCLFLLELPYTHWNEEVAEAVEEKKTKYRKWKKENTKEARMEYKKSRQNAKRVISSAKEKKQKECANDLNDSECQNFSNGQADG